MTDISVIGPKDLNACIGLISLIYVNDWMVWHYFAGLSKIKTANSAQPPQKVAQ